MAFCFWHFAFGILLLAFCIGVKRVKVDYCIEESLGIDMVRGIDLGFFAFVSYIRRVAFFLVFEVLYRVNQSWKSCLKDSWRRR